MKHLVIFNSERYGETPSRSFEIMTDEEWLQMDSIIREHTYPFSFFIGDNEDIQVVSELSLRNMIDIYSINEQEEACLRTWFQGGRFGHIPYALTEV